METQTNEVVAIVPRSLSEAQSMSVEICKAALLPEHLRGKPADALAIIMTGAELGLPPMQALRGFDNIKGKVAPKAELLGALVMRRADVCVYLQCTETSATKAVYETHRKGNPKPTTMSFTMEQATRAGVANGDNWRKYPEAMLRARALSAICRAVYPDVILGLGSVEELEGETVDAQPATRTESVKAAVMASGKARRLAIQDEAPEPRASPPTDAEVVKTPGDVVAELVAAAGVPASRSRAFVLGATGKKNRADMTDADVETVREALSVFDSQVVNEGGAT